MVFHLLLLAVLIVAAIHVARLETRSSTRIGELGLLYILVGYCGVPMVGLSILSLARPDLVAEALGFPGGNPFQEFLSWAFLGMSLLSVLALRYRGAYLIGPALVWTVFFAGATVVHFRDFASRGHLTHGSMLAIFVSHGMIALLLAVALLMSGLLKRSAEA